MSNITMTLNFPDIPLWQGVQLIPGNYRSLPFALEWDKHGFAKQSADEIQKKQIIDQYSNCDYQFITAPPGYSPWANSLGDKEVQFILRSCGDFTGKKVLEIGAGSLYLGERILEQGAVQYVIMDPAVKEKSKDTRLEVVEKYFSKDLCANQRYDVVICLNCLEHLEEPYKFLCELRWLLNKSNGCAILVFPDISTQFGNGDLNALLHEHISYFTLSTAEQLMRNSGLRVLAKETNSDCLRFLVVAQEEFIVSFPEYMDENYIRMPNHFQTSMKKFRNILRGAMSRSESIAIHGATNGANNALYLAQMGQYEHIRIFDGDETKAGKFLPLCINPVKHSASSDYRDYSTVYVAALTYFDAIKKELMQKHHFTEDQIVPLFSSIE